jgi:glutathione S-transferase
MIELYYFPGNASFTPHVLLRELDVPFALRLVDRGAGEHKQPAYLQLNPNGVIPVLVDGSLVLYETAAICLHLADTHPHSELLPPLGTPERAQAYKWIIWSTNTLQATLSHYFYPERMVDAGNSAGALQVKAHAQARIGDLLTQVDKQLAGHRSSWFFGEQFSAIDPYVFMLCRWTRGFDLKPAREYPNIGPYLARMLERPAVQRTFEAEGLGAPWY